MMLKSSNKPSSSTKTLVMHTCCAPCSSLPIVLFDSIEPFVNIGLSIEQVPNVVYYFYNPNIQPIEEYAIRRDELKKYAIAKNVDLVVYETDDGEKQWDDFVAGFEAEKESGARCEKCFEMRLLSAFEYAKKINADYVATVMSISPHKNTNTINRIGKALEAQFQGIEFLCFNFKKQDGFLKSTQISREYGMYRQKYCGCKYSIRK